MKISVKNLGPIKSGTVNLNERFTVFVGYNNSGKTYMANVIWSFYHHYLKSDLENNNGAFQQFADELPAKIINDYFVVPTHHSFKNFNLNITDNESNNTAYTPYFLPANRIFYPSYYKYIFLSKKEESDAVEEKLRTGNGKELHEIIERPYHKYVDVLLQHMATMGKFPKDFYADILDELRQMLGGEIILKNIIGFPKVFLKLNNGEEIEMHLASSSNNQLALFYLYLKYFCKAKNNLLIIDEPEENLHPNHQAALAKLLVNFANRNNNKVIVTTHSSFFTDCINNYIKLSQIQGKGMDVPEEVSAELLSDFKGYALKPDDFGVYFFNGEKIKPYRMREYGVFFKDFNEATKKMNDMASWLDGVIYESKYSNV